MLTAMVMAAGCLLLIINRDSMWVAALLLTVVCGIEGTEHEW